MSLAARQRYFDDAGGKCHPQRVTLAVDLHADDALVLHAVDAAPGRERESVILVRGANCVKKRNRGR